jgi:hypothetical protein
MNALFHDEPNQDILNRRTMNGAELQAAIATGHKLYDWDGFGYPMAYYTGDQMHYFSRFPTETEPQVHDGEYVLNLDGDVLCAGCAMELTTEDWEFLYTAYQINGDIGDCETVYCSNCNGIIYDGDGACN